MKYLFWGAVVCFGLAWTVYFYGHMDTLCTQWWIRTTKECIAYNVSKH